MVAADIYNMSRHARRARPGDLCLRLEGIGKTALIRGCVNEDTEYRIGASSSQETLTNKTITDITNDVSAGKITSDGTIYTISGTPTVGQVIINTGPDSLGWANPSSAAPTTAKGDLLACDGTAGTISRLPVGADGQVLVANSAASTGLSYTNTLAGTTISGPQATFNNYYYPTIIANASTSPLVRDSGTGYIGLGSNFLTVTNSLPVQNKILDTITTTFGDYSATGTKAVAVNLAGATNGTTSQLVFSATANRSYTFPDAAGTLVLDAAAQTITNKTVNSAANTITITSGALAGTNINSVLNQALLSTSSPTFGQMTLTTGLSLPTIGGTSALLNYYEESNFTHAWGGPWASPISAAVRYTRIGRIVVASFGRCTGVSSNTARIVSDAIPLRFRPVTPLHLGPWTTVVPAVNNSATAITATITFDTSNWYIYTDLSSALVGSPFIGMFSGSGTVGFFEFTLAYSV
jgi:hypothetical protein